MYNIYMNENSNMKPFLDRLEILRNKKELSVDEFISLIRLMLEIRKKDNSLSEAMFLELFYLQRDYFWDDDMPSEKKIPTNIDNLISNMVDVYDIDEGENIDSYWEELEKELQYIGESDNERNERIAKSVQSYVESEESK